MAVQNAKCHFVNEQQLICSITRNGTVVIIVKKHDMLMLVISIQSASSKCPPTAFCTPGVIIKLQSDGCYYYTQQWRPLVNVTR